MDRSMDQLDQRRREFLSFMGRGAIGAGVLASPFLQGCVSILDSWRGSSSFRTRPSDTDELILAPGLRYEVLLKWQESLGRPNLNFGFNNDFLAFFPFEGKTNEGLLCVNHEAPNPIFVSDYKRGTPRTKEQIEKEMDSVGVSIVHIVEKEPGSWRVVPNSSHNRRITGRTPIPFAGAKRVLGASEAVGTTANCAGGVTPWGTYLTCEENFDEFYGSVEYVSGRRVPRLKGLFEWFAHFPHPSEHYGWVVEIDPLTGKAKKHVSMGRFAHECATTRPAADGRCVVYTGDDSAGEHLYKFISDKPGSLETGVLYVADTENGRWLPLERDKQPALKKAFRDQLEMLIRTREAAKLIGATPLDRPEDIEICPRTGAVYLTLTNNIKAGNFFGSIFKIVEKNNDPLSLEFTASTFVSGGIESGFACPDNLVFDRGGNLWMTSDISGSTMNKGAYLPFKNNGLFFIPMDEPGAGRPVLVATAPRDAEFTGPMFSPDGKTLFLSVQHPGEESRSLSELTSHWPDGGTAVPRPAVVAISGNFPVQ